MLKSRNDNDNQLKTRGQLSTIDDKIAEVRNRKKKVKYMFFLFYKATFFFRSILENYS